jgi:tryptophan synthase beta subunit
MQRAGKMEKDKVVVITVSGRGDKDLDTVVGLGGVQ